MLWSDEGQGFLSEIVFPGHQESLALCWGLCCALMVSKWRWGWRTSPVPLYLLHAELPVVFSLEGWSRTLKWFKNHGENSCFVYSSDQTNCFFQLLLVNNRSSSCLLLGNALRGMERDLENRDCNAWGVDKHPLICLDMFWADGWANWPLEVHSNKNCSKIQWIWLIWGCVAILTCLYVFLLRLALAFAGFT